MLEPLLLEIALLFALCVGVGLTFLRLRLPPIVGFLVTGAIVGPYSLGLARHPELVRNLAEVGVVVLLFAVGMEVPLHLLRRMRRQVGLGGGLQIIVTVVAVASCAWLTGMAWNQAVFLGFLVSLSSTAAVAKILSDHGEFSAPHGRLAMSVCLAQDLAIVPMILLLPMLGGDAHGAEGGSAILTTLQNLGVLALVLAFAWFVVPRILGAVARTRSRELFVLTLGTLCLAMAVATAHLGMSMALGAFLAGILVADSDYHGQALAEVEPFKDALASLFFVSIGMLFDPRILVEEPVKVSLMLAAVLGGKALIVALATRPLGAPGWVRWRAGLTIAQVGEFSFVLVQAGLGQGVLDSRLERVFLVVAVLSIALTPIMYALGRRLARGSEGGATTPGTSLSGHAIVVGYGPTGRAVVHALRECNVPVLAVEMNAATVAAEKKAGVPIVHGDASRMPVLRALGIDRARMLVLAVNDHAAARRVAEVVRRQAPQVHVLARAVYNAEVEFLRRAGAHDVVPQELEASVEILVRALRRFLVPDNEVGRQARAARQDAGVGDKAAGIDQPDAQRIGDYIPGLSVEVLRVGAGADVAKAPLGEVHFRKRTGCTVVAVRRGADNQLQIGPDVQLQADDVAVVIGPQARLADAAALFLATQS